MNFLESLQIQNVQCLIDGMNSENKKAELAGNPPPYGMEEFHALINEIRSIADNYIADMKKIRTTRK